MPALPGSESDNQSIAISHQDAFNNLMIIENVFFFKFKHWLVSNVSHQSSSTADYLVVSS